MLLGCIKLYPVAICTCSFQYLSTVTQIDKLVLVKGGSRRALAWPESGREAESYSARQPANQQLPRARQVARQPADQLKPVRQLARARQVASQPARASPMRQWRELGQQLQSLSGNSQTQPGKFRATQIASQSQWATSQNWSWQADSQIQPGKRPELRRVPFTELASAMHPGDVHVVHVTIQRAMLGSNVKPFRMPGKNQPSYQSQPTRAIQPVWWTRKATLQVGRACHRARKSQPAGTQGQPALQSAQITWTRQSQLEG